MADIFGYNRKGSSGVFSQAGYGDAVLTIGGKGSPSLVQDWRISYQQRPTPMYEVGSAKVYWLKEPPQGSFAVSKIVGGTPILYTPPDKCDNNGETLTLKQSKSCDASVGTYVMRGCVLSTFGASSQAGRPYITENVEWTISGLELA